jgi:hypothetical protein
LIDCDDPDCDEHHACNGGPGPVQCGNDICEPPLETPENCPQDCALQTL